MLILPVELPAPEVLFDAFFDCMNKVGYASPTAVIRADPVVKDWKIVCHDGHFGNALLKVTDRWGKKGGRTLITLEFDAVPAKFLLWAMSYRGAYEREALPVLKNVLRKTYAEKHFCGGRGEDLYSEGAFKYQNRWEGDFTDFRSEETIRKNGALLGSHRCWGGMMIPDPLSAP